MKPKKSRRYEKWAGKPGGVPENLNNCVENVGFGDVGSPGGRQCSRLRGYGKDGLYCRQHAGQTARDAAREKAYEARGAENAVIQREGAELIKRVGAGRVYYSESGPGYRRELILSFETVERLLAP